MNFENKKELLTALNKAKSEFLEVKKNKTLSLPGRPSYKYADLESIMASTKDALFRNGLVIFFDYKTERVDNMINLECACSIVHSETCQSLSSATTVSSTFLDKDNLAQKIGSLMTYARRYALCALLGIVAEDDDDASSLNDANSRQNYPALNLISKDKCDELARFIKEFDPDLRQEIVDNLKEKFGIQKDKTLASLKNSDFDTAVEFLKNLKEKMRS